MFLFLCKGVVISRYVLFRGSELWFNQREPDDFGMYAYCLWMN